MRNDLTLNEYQEYAAKTAVYPGRGSFLGLSYVAGKLAGESGEVAENVFKALRDDSIAASIYDWGPRTDVDFRMEPVTVRFDVINPARKEKIKKELGDALWYISQAAWELGCTLEDIASDNILKLADRAKRNVLHGAGDDR